MNLGIISLKQMQDIADQGRIDFTESLATISNLIIKNAQNPADVEKVIDDSEKKHEDVKPTRFPPGRYETFLPDLKVTKAMYKTIPIDFVDKETYRLNKKAIREYLLSRGGLVYNVETTNTNGLSTMDKAITAVKSRLNP